MSPSESIPPPPSGAPPALSMPVAFGPETAPGRGGRPGLRAAALLGTVAIVAAAILLIGPGGHDSRAPFAPIADAAERMQSYPGFEMDFTGSASSPQTGESIRMTGGGVFNGQTGRARIAIRTQGASSGDFSVTEVADDSTFYLQVPGLASQLPNGASWMKLDLSDELPDPDQDVGSLDPAEQFQQLQAVSPDARSVGQEKVGGVITTHYAATVDLNRQVDLLRDQGEDEAADQLEKVIDANGQSSTPVDVWIDQKGLIRRMDMTIPFGAVAGPGASISMSMELTHFWAEPKIDLPPESDVFDATEIAKQSLQQITG
ncbi:hypothetical protein BH10ACT11_BH10ACT11_12300 [soil metagenome]